eukprot:PhF_6_TR1532/c0_g1_i1/m.2800
MSAQHKVSFVKLSPVGSPENTVMLVCSSTFLGVMIYRLNPFSLVRICLSGQLVSQATLCGSMLYIVRGVHDTSISSSRRIEMYDVRNEDDEKHIGSIDVPPQACCSSGVCDLFVGNNGHALFALTQTAVISYSLDKVDMDGEVDKCLLRSESSVYAFTDKWICYPGDTASPQGTKLAQILSTETMEIVTLIDTKHTKDIAAMQFAPHDRVITISAGGTVARIFDVKTGYLQCELRRSSFWRATVRTLSCSNNGLVVLHTEKQTMHLFKDIPLPSGGEGAVMSVVNPAVCWDVTGMEDGQGIIYLDDLGEVMFIACADGWLRVYSIGTQKMVSEHKYSR